MLNDTKTLEGLLRDCREKVSTDYGLELLSIRDLHTGAPIGRIDDEVFHTALIDEGVLDDSEDGSTLSIEDLADALLVRSLASARPSPALNRPTTQSLKRLLESQPRVVIAYLLNRYHLTHWRKLNHRDDSWFDDILHRVKVWEKLGELADCDEPDLTEGAFRDLAHWLLELDSKLNLHELTPPATLFPALEAATTLADLRALIGEFELAIVPVLVEADRQFSIGNRLASSAYFKSWFDNPALAERKVEIANKTSQRLYDRWGNVQVGKMIEGEKIQSRKIKAAKRAADDSRIIKGRSSRSRAAQLVNKHSAALDALFKTLGDTISESQPTTPAPTPVAKRSTGLPKLVKG